MKDSKSVLLPEDYNKLISARNEEFEKKSNLKLKDKLGQGGFSQIYLGQHKDTNKTYAIKVV